jgi:hypothetical protein
MSAAIWSLTLALQAAASTAPVSGLPIVGADAEDFLRTAEVVAVRDLNAPGVTRPRKVELSDGRRTAFAVFKTVDEHAMRKRFPDGSIELNFSDSFKYEIAAYELDKLLGLGLVPPAVARRIGRDLGSLTLWVEGAVSEAERLQAKDSHPPDLFAWNNQIQTVRLFLELIHDTDYRNVNNLLVTSDWKIYTIDSSRAFRTTRKLQEEETLQRFSRRVLASLEALDRPTLDQRLGEWLDARQLDGLWARRNLILELAARRTAERGEAATLFD